MRTVENGGNLTFVSWMHPGSYTETVEADFFYPNEKISKNICNEIMNKATFINKFVS